MTNTDVFTYHKKNKGKIQVTLTSPINSYEDLSLAYTPGVGKVSQAIAEDPQKAYDYTLKGRSVAIITDGSAVLGLGNVGPLAALPVMEGKAAIFKQFANIDAFPICLNTQDTQEIIRTVRAISPSFGAVNLEDIAAPKCFGIESSLQDLGIPVMHDDQHATAIITLAGLINSAKVVNKDLSSLQIVVLGAGAAGTAIAELISKFVKDIIVVDSKGIISSARTDLDEYKKELLKKTNKSQKSGNFQDALSGSDVFIGVSKENLLNESDIQLMQPNPVIFALANPTPEIMPDVALKAGAAIVATGRSDFPNQINNCLVFPGVFRGLLSSNASHVTREMKEAAAEALASLVDKPDAHNIVPTLFDDRVVPAVEKAILDNK